MEDEDRLSTLDVGVFTQQCRDKSHENEDRFTVERQLAPDLSYIAVFDGHGGDGCASFMAESVHTLIDVTTTSKETALNTAIQKAEDKFMDSFPSDASGCCIVAALISNDEIALSHVGDCRAIVSKVGALCHETKDHSASSESEKERIKESGGLVVRGRLFGLLAVSRSLGDREFKQEQVSGSLITTCDSVTIPRTPEVEFIILASDGLWDKVESQSALGLVWRQLFRKSNSAKQTARELALRALAKGTNDDITVLVCQLASESKREDEPVDLDSSTALMQFFQNPDGTDIDLSARKHSAPALFADSSFKANKDDIEAEDFFDLT